MFDVSTSHCTILWELLMKIRSIVVLKVSVIRVGFEIIRFKLCLKANKSSFRRSCVFFERKIDVEISQNYNLNVTLTIIDISTSILQHINLIYYLGIFCSVLLVKVPRIILVTNWKYYPKSCVLFSCQLLGSRSIFMEVSYCAK